MPIHRGKAGYARRLNGPEALLFNKNRAAVNGGPKLLDQSWNAPPLRRCSHTEALIVRDRCDDRHRYWVTVLPSSPLHSLGRGLTATGLVVVPPNFPSHMSSVHASNTCRSCGSTVHGESLVLRYRQVLFCRPLDRNRGGRKDRGGDCSRADQSQFAHAISPGKGQTRK